MTAHTHTTCLLSFAAAVLALLAVLPTTVVAQGAGGGGGGGGGSFSRRGSSHYNGGIDCSTVCAIAIGSIIGGIFLCAGLCVGCCLHRQRRKQAAAKFEPERYVKAHANDESAIAALEGGSTSSFLPLGNFLLRR